MNQIVKVEISNEKAVAYVHAPETVIDHVTTALNRTGYGNIVFFAENSTTAPMMRAVKTKLVVIPLSDREAIQNDMKMFREIMDELAPNVTVEIREL